MRNSVAIKGHCYCSSAATDNLSVDDQLHSTGTVKQYRPVNGQLDGDTHREAILGGERHSATRDVNGLADTRLTDGLSGNSPERFSPTHRLCTVSRGA